MARATFIIRFDQAFSKEKLWNYGLPMDLGDGFGLATSVITKVARPSEVGLIFRLTRMDMLEPGSKFFPAGLLAGKLAPLAPLPPG